MSEFNHEPTAWPHAEPVFAPDPEDGPVAQIIPIHGVDAAPLSAVPHEGVIAPLDHEERVTHAALLDLDHHGLAERTVLYVGDRLAWRPAIGRFMWWWGTHWVVDEHDGSGLAGGAVRSVIRATRRLEPEERARIAPEVQKAQAALDSAAVLGLDVAPFQTALSAARQRVRGECEKVAREWANGTHAVNSALIAVRLSLTVEEHEWDDNPFLINCPNGTINIKHVDDRLRPVLRPHDPQDRITMITPVCYVEEARSEDLERVREQMDRAGAGTYKAFNRWLGYSATGAMDAKTFVNMYGKPDAAKSTLTDAVFKALGGHAKTGYATTLSPSNLGVGAREGTDTAQPSLDACRGKRFVVVPEAEHSYLGSDLVKKITGGDPIRTRGNYADGDTWQPSMKLTITGNGPIKMRTSDAGLVRRLWPIEVLPIPGRLDAGIKHRLEDEAKGQEAVLRAVVRGACAWYHDYKRGGHTAKEALLIPADVEARKADYITKVNPLSEWIEEEFEVGDEDGFDNVGRGTTKRLLLAHNTWKKKHGGKPMGPREFAENLDALGFRTGKRTEFTVRLGGMTVTEKGLMREGLRLHREAWEAAHRGW